MLDPTPGVDLPPVTADPRTIYTYATLFDGQTGQLDKSNQDKAGAKRILAICREEQAKAVAAARKRPWFHIF